jgi:putative membrane protein
MGRGLVPLLVLAGLSQVHRGHGDTTQYYLWVGIIVFGVVFGAIHWFVTRWAFDGATLQIETGLVRRDSQQLPVTRIQAVDLVAPFLARILGLAELRIRVAGAKSANHLAYLSLAVATDLRARLLATHHGLDQSVPEPDELPAAVVAPGRLLGSVLLSASTLGAGVFVVALVVLSTVSTAAATAVAGSLLVYLLGIGQGIWRRFNEQYRFTVALAPDGIRVRRGLLSTVSETIPTGRVQAVRQIEPLLWRMFGWCRLEVDLAGVPGHGRSGGSGRVTKALLPVGSHESALYLRRVVIGPVEPPLSRASARARLKAPFSYHFLAAGSDDAMAVAVTGRVQKVTCWVPLVKAQSIRKVQGPVQRALQLATVSGPSSGTGPSKKPTAWSRSSPPTVAAPVDAWRWPPPATRRGGRRAPMRGPCHPHPSKHRSWRRGGSPTRRDAISGATGTERRGPNTSPTTAAPVSIRPRPAPRRASRRAAPAERQQPAALGHEGHVGRLDLHVLTDGLAPDLCVGPTSGGIDGVDDLCGGGAGAVDRPT